jgi:hypothetical protein
MNCLFDLIQLPDNALWLFPILCYIWTAQINSVCGKRVRETRRIVSAYPQYCIPVDGHVAEGRGGGSPDPSGGTATDPARGTQSPVIFIQ